MNETTSEGGGSGMKKIGFFVVAMSLLFFLFGIQAEAMAPGAAPVPTPASACGSCIKLNCFRSSEYWYLHMDQLPGGAVYVGGVNFNNPIGTNSYNQMWLALRGNQVGASTPTQKLNQEMVAFQVSLLFAQGGGGSPAYFEAMDAQLCCYGFTNTTILSNGAAITPQTTLRELLTQAVAAFKEYRSADYLPLWDFFFRLNTDDPSPMVCNSKWDPAMYCCQEVVQEAAGTVSGTDCSPIKPGEQYKCTGYSFSCTNEILTPAGLSKCKVVP
jgi:hypothetical protein